METTAVKVAENKYVYINPDAYASLIELMDNEKKYPTVLTGKVGFAGMCIGVI